MAHVGLRDISRSKMSVKWDTSVGELVLILTIRHDFVNCRVFAVY